VRTADYAPAQEPGTFAKVESGLMASEASGMLRGNLRGLARYAELVAALGHPLDGAESALLVMLARILSDDETTTLIGMIRRG
jgi:hypothetical protein